MASAGSAEVGLQAENLRLQEQVRAFSGDEHVHREAECWREATPEERVAETWRLCALLPWFRSLWPDDVRRRADVPEPLPRETLALLERLKQEGDQR
jgi:hypothetical protein